MLSDEMDIFSVDLNIINLDDANFCEDDPKTIFHASVVARHNKLKQIQNIQKIITKELIPVAWYPTIW